MSAVYRSNWSLECWFPSLKMPSIKRETDYIFFVVLFADVPNRLEEVISSFLFFLSRRKTPVFNCLLHLFQLDTPKSKYLKTMNDQNKFAYLGWHFFSNLLHLKIYVFVYLSSLQTVL